MRSPPKPKISISISHLLFSIAILALAKASSFYDNPEQDPLPDFKAREWGGNLGDDGVRYGRETREELEARWGYDVGCFLFCLVYFS